MLQVSPDAIMLFLYFDGVTRLMIADLEPEKAMDSCKRLGIMCDYSQLRTEFSGSLLCISIAPPSVRRWK